MVRALSFAAERESIHALTSSQGLELPAFILAALTASGGIVGYARTRSKPSIIAGVSVGLLCEFRPPSCSQ
jgi:hypothetical protein